jgi:hypothetical protein
MPAVPPEPKPAEISQRHREASDRSENATTVPKQAKIRQIVVKGSRSGARKIADSRANVPRTKIELTAINAPTCSNESVTS